MYEKVKGHGVEFNHTCRTITNAVFSPGSFYGLRTFEAINLP